MMVSKKMGQNEYSPVLVCGASVAFLNHKPGEPTVFDRIAHALGRGGDAGRGFSAEHGAVPAHGIAG